MDLQKILGNVEGSEELIKQIEAEIGKDFVPRSEFNEKNTALKNLEKQFSEVNANLEEANKHTAKFEKQIMDLTGEVNSHKAASLKARIAHETGIPHELAMRLTGEDEDEIRADAQSLSALIQNNTPLPPLKDTEPKVDGEDAPYKAVLQNIKGD